MLTAWTGNHSGETAIAFCRAKISRDRLWRQVAPSHYRRRGDCLAVVADRSRPCRLAFGRLQVKAQAAKARRGAKARRRVKAGYAARRKACRREACRREAGRAGCRGFETGGHAMRPAKI